jgi:hypothetical protein
VRHDYCTLFDSNYLARGLTLYRSLERCDDDFLLRAVCMDTESRDLLSRLSLPRMRILDIDDVERADPGLVEVRATRTPWEYCWTATPVVCGFILDREPAIEVLTYLDADLSFSSSSDPLFRELGDDSIILIPHRNDGATGVYNVGWISFRNDGNGREALAWWRDRCLEWCFDRFEENRFGDQKYLDDWPERFGGVKVCTNDAAGLGPWNDELHRLTVNGSGEVLVDGAPLIFYHHSGLRVHRGDTVSGSIAPGFRRFRATRGPARLTWSIAYDVRSRQAMELIWKPYVAHLAAAVEELRGVGAAATLGMRFTPLRDAAGELWFTGPFKPLRNAFRRTPARLQERVRRVASPR